MTQPQRPEQCVIRILNVDGVTVGAGFVVAQRLAVTCAHVVRAARSDAGQPIRIQFFAGGDLHYAVRITN